MKINCKDNLLSLSVELTVHWFSRERNRFGGTLVIGQGAQPAGNVSTSDTGTRPGRERNPIRWWIKKV